MTKQIYTEDTDAQEFIRFVENAVSNLVDQICPDEFFLVRIDNWFDHKWLKFSGKAVVPYPERAAPVPHQLGGWIDSALEERYRDKVTFPPFNPNRVLRQQYFRKAGVKKKRPIHRSYRECTGENLQRRVTQYSQSGVFAWFSSNTHANGRGSLMVYTVQNDDVSTWYASFLRKDGWKLGQVKGISTETVEGYLKAPERYTQQDN